GEDFLPATAALRGTANQPGHVENLNLRAPMLEETGNHVQRGEVVRGHRAVRVRDLIEQRRLADGRESDEAGGRIPALLDGIARSTAAPFEAPRLLLVLEPSQLRLQPADVMLGRLVVRRLLDLVLGRFDLLFDRHSMTNRAGPTPKNFSTRPLRWLFETDHIPLGILKRRDTTEPFSLNWAHGHAAVCELGHD